MGQLYNIKLKNLLPEHYTSICITHDIGKVIMMEHLPERYDASVAFMNNNPDADFYQSELELGFGGATHAEIGAYFLDLWGLPLGSIEASLYHHDLKDYRESSHDILEICHTADLLSNYIVAHPNAMDEELPSFLEEYTEKERVYDLIGRLKEKCEHLK